ncbi:MAG: hypothetical protein PHU62_06925 [Bacteroidales bacterium]|nr:hypothetical protein [Bacteroidales bacterium]MDD3914457.1 hypothetical protein [Bacteroidales bacterium]MDD4634285.1 hypothetical protein [Bacteroidales bacterium]
MLLFESSPFWLLLCVLAAVLSAGILYWKKKNSSIGKKLKALLFVLRATTFFLLYSMLLNIVLVKTLTSYTKPLLISAVDDSRSMVAAKDSSIVSTFFNDDYENVIANLKKTFLINDFLFGENIKQDSLPSFTQNISDISSAFLYADRLYDNSIDGMLLFSDGIFNSGFNPVSMAEKLKYPVFVVAVGDTSELTDFAISKIRYNDVVYMQSECVFEVNMLAKGFENKELVLQIYDNEKLSSSRNIKITDKTFYQTFNVNFKPSYAGKHFYQFKLVSLGKNDAIETNNYKTCVVNVVENKKIVTIVYNGAHPDVAAIKSAIENFAAFDVKAVEFADFDENEINLSDILILHGLPEKSNKSKQLMEIIDKEKIPYLSVVSAKTNISQFNTLNKDVSIESFNNNYESSYPDYNEGFTSFKVSEADKAVFKFYTPLTSPFGIYQLPAQSDVMFTQIVGKIPTTRPMIIATQDFGRRRAFIFGEGLWMWRIKNYVEKTNHEAFDKLINGLINYLSLSDSFKRFQVDVDDEYFEDETIKFDAVLYNDSYEPYNLPDAQINIRNESGMEYPFFFSKTDGSYSINIGTLSAGYYTWKADAGDQKAEGAFYVSTANPEYADLQARYDLLKSVAAITGGEFMSIDETEKIQNILSSSISSKKEFTYKKQDKLTNHIPIFAIIILLLAIEWTLRRRNGIY